MPQKPETPIGKDFNPGGARWCEDHNRLECAKQRRKGRGQCHQLAVRGTAACKIHVGMKVDLAVARGEAAITAWSAIGSDAGLVDHKMIVLRILQMTWLRLNAYGELLRQQVAVHGGGQPARVYDPDDPEGDGQVEVGGLIGHRYGAAGRNGNIYAQNEEIRALVALEAAERDRAVKYAETAHKMGISDRLTALAEQWGDVVALRVTLMLSELNLTPEQERMVPELVTRHLSQIEMGPVERP